MKLYRFLRLHVRMGRFSSATGLAVWCGMLLAVSASAAFCAWDTRAGQAEAAGPVVVQPGAPGQPSKTLPGSTKGTLPPRSRADVEFMQGMIMHHSQAVEMTALIASHTENKELRSLGARISSSQADEIRFMKRWLAGRGEATSVAMAGMAAGMAKTDASKMDTSATDSSKMNMPGTDMGSGGMALMPGMLSAEQMEALREAKGAEFDRLFLTGMIQHHGGALTMVKDLFDTAGAGQDADLFNFATDADNTQRAEIRIMQGMLEKKSSGEKR
ncbi:MAG TPA: DUF305 domain-containing protein [Candidatus Acidoferrum sp.]|nr:DUF305 domain-containing protein [Candidatus Acidoferrum sp.]